MSAIRFLAALAVVALTLIAPLSVRACPLCSEAIATSNDANDADDVDNFPTAMNQSIYLMLAVPYTALGVAGFFIYRGMRQNDEYRRQQNSQEPRTE